VVKVTWVFEHLYSPVADTMQYKATYNIQEWLTR